MSAPRLLYLHGFASGPSSKKGLAFEAHFAARGVTLTRLDLRRPSLAHLRLSAMLDEVRDHLAERTILIGSSLGGLTAARLAERDPRVIALVLLAPAFQLVPRWRERLGEDGWAAWQRSGALDIIDHTTGAPATVDFAFADDAATIDAAGDGWPDVRVPTLVLHGRRDEVVGIDQARAFVARCPTARLIELDDGHELIATLPTVLAEATAFLDGLAAD
jgi:hypothetical protein